MMITKESIKNFLNFILLVVIIMGVFVYVHEHTHAVIYYYFGCENITEHYLDWSNNSDAPFMALAYTRADCDNGYVKGNMYASHSMNDIIGYNVIPFLIAILLLLKKIGDGY